MTTSEGGREQRTEDEKDQGLGEVKGKKWWLSCSYSSLQKCCAAAAVQPRRSHLNTACPWLVLSASFYFYLYLRFFFFSLSTIFLPAILTAILSLSMLYILHPYCIKYISTCICTYIRASVHFEIYVFVQTNIALAEATD